MKRIISEPTWGAIVIEDTDTNEFSFQCLCGGVGMYWERVLLNSDEVQRIRDGTFDADQMVSDVCKHTPNVNDRIVEIFDTDELIRDKPAPKL